MAVGNAVEQGLDAVLTVVDPVLGGGGVVQYILDGCQPAAAVVVYFVMGVLGALGLDHLVSHFDVGSRAPSFADCDSPVRLVLGAAERGPAGGGFVSLGGLGDKAAAGAVLGGQPVG